jgi:isoleucyl-tRNA synthetase
VKEELINGNKEINWHPEHIKYGRFGDWLENNVDWAFSRERYWGTPLPIWRCESCKYEECIGSVKELKEKKGIKGADKLADLHRPYVDEVVYSCPKCNGEMRRVPEVIDCWFDSGAMPFAQWHCPFENQDTFRANFPADYICEAVDQTRGWFYTLHALSTMLFDQPCYRNVICLGHILDAKGEKMSKSRGTAADPVEILDREGADALRWYLVSATPLWLPTKFDRDCVTEVASKLLATLRNMCQFSFCTRTSTASSPAPRRDLLPQSRLSI